MESQELAALTADIVSAHVSNNRLDASEVGNLIKVVGATLGGLGTEQTEAPTEKVPVVSVRASIKPDYIVCMECGRKAKMLKRHLQTAHGMSPDDYRRDYGLPGSYPMVAEEYANRRRELAKASGLGRKNDKKAQESA